MKRKIPKQSTPILNEIIEKLASERLTASEYRIILAVIRKTYGWDKKSAWIAGSVFQDMTKISQHNCYKIIKSLLKKKILNKDGKKIGINKKVAEWEVKKEAGQVSQQILSSEIVSNQIVSNQIVSSGIQKDIPADTKIVSQHTNIKEKKETIKRNNINITASPKVVEEKKIEYGNPDINMILKFLAKKIGIDEFSESQRQQRMFAKHIFNLGKKWAGLGYNSSAELSRRLEWVLSDAWRAEKSNSIKYLYSQLKAAPMDQIIDPNQNSDVFD